MSPKTSNIGAERPTMSPKISTPEPALRGDCGTQDLTQRCEERAQVFDADQISYHRGLPSVRICVLLLRLALSRGSSVAI